MSKETPKRLVLGFDAGCSTCAEMAQKVKEKVGEKLEVVNLREPEVMQWREEALGENAPWTPTLFEVNGGAVKAWTGKRMGLKLGRALGPVATWRVMQVLGEVGATPEIAEASPVARIGASMSRGQFLKGVGGAAVAMGVLSATGKLASPAQAQVATSTRPLTGDRLVRVARRVAGRKDVVNVLGKEFPNKIRNGGVIRQCQNGNCITVISGGNCRVSQVNGDFKFSGDCVPVFASRQTLENGNTLTAVTYQVAEDKFLAYYGYRVPELGTKDEAILYKVTYEEGDAGLSVIDSSRNGGLDTPIPEPPGPAPEEGSETSFRAQAAACSGCQPTGPGDPTPGKELRERCKRTRVIACAASFGGCFGCSAACFIIGPTCIGCILSTCSAAVANCCGDGTTRVCSNCLP